MEMKGYATFSKLKSRSLIIKYSLVSYPEHKLVSSIAIIILFNIVELFAYS